MSLAQQLIPTAKLLIEEFGTNVVLKTPSSNTYNPATGLTTTIAGTETTIKADISQYSSEEIQGLILSGDLKIMISADGVTLGVDDKIVFDSIDWNIINTMPTYLQGLVVIYELQVRK